METIVGGISQVQLVVLMRGFRGLAEEREREFNGDEYENNEFAEIAEVDNVDWFREKMEERGYAVVSRR